MPNSILYKKIYNFLLDLIQSNRSIPNFKLPSERTLALKFNASRRPVQLAYKKLTEQGYVETIQGKGCFIKHSPDENTVAVQIKKDIKIDFITPSTKTAFMQQILSGLSRFCDEHLINLSIMISNDNTAKEKKLLQTSTLSDSRGIVLFPVDEEFFSEEVLRLSIGKYPLTIVDRYLPPLNLSFVTTDNYKAMVDAVQFLHKNNFKHIVFITPPKSITTTTDERINGFNHGLFKYYGMAMAHNLLKLVGNASDTALQEKTIAKFLKAHPETEVIITLGVHAPIVLATTAKLGISVPEQLKLMVFDDEFTRAERRIYKPYVIQQDGEAMGYLAAEALYNQIYGDMRVTIKKLPVHILDYSKCE